MEAAFFDLDKTVIAKASMVAFGRPLYDAGMISRWLVVRAMWSNTIFHYMGADEERMRKFRQSALRITAGWDQALVSAIVRDALHEVIEPIVYDEALDLIREHQRAGRRVFIISASPEEIVAPLAQFLGVDEAIASRAQLDTDGRYTGEVEFWSYGPYKAEAIVEAAARHGIDLESSYAYSDSATDVPMLELVGHPVAVNPDRELAKVAREREWEVRQFEHGVPLRERVTMPPPGKTLLVVGTVALVAGAATLAWTWWARQRTRSGDGFARLDRSPAADLRRLRDLSRAARNGSSVESTIETWVRTRPIARPAASPSVRAESIARLRRRVRRRRSLARSHAAAVWSAARLPAPPLVRLDAVDVRRLAASSPRRLRGRGRQESR
jgi:HAD superfamily hydrolase (TIGR01490 family)